MTEVYKGVMATTTLQQMTSTLQPILSTIKSSQLYKLINKYRAASCAIFSIGYIISRYFTITAYRKLKQYPSGPGDTYPIYSTHPQKMHHIFIHIRPPKYTQLVYRSLEALAH